MVIDPTLGAAIVTAAGSLLQKVLELAKQARDDDKAGKVISKVYDKVADAVTPNSLRALVVLRDVGSFSTPKQVATLAQSLAQRQEPDGEAIEPDVTYRLKYLCLLGLVRQGSTDYALTNLGGAFIDKASQDKFRYSTVFSMLRG
jgi:hypothetical protein